MNKNYVFRSFGLLVAVAALSLAACGKKSSSSSSSGSTSGALGGLSALSNGTGALSVNGIRPKGGGVSCSGSLPNMTCNCSSGGNLVLTGSFGSASPTCPTGYTTTQAGLSSNITETATNCQTGGYTYNGAITFAAPATAVVNNLANGTAPFDICSGTSGTSLTGSFGLTSSSMSITGNGVNLLGCNVQIDSYLSDVTPTSGAATISGSVGWSVSGGNCGTSTGSSSF